MQLPLKYSIITPGTRAATAVPVPEIQCLAALASPENHLRHAPYSGVFYILLESLVDMLVPAAREAITPISPAMFDPESAPDHIKPNNGGDA